MVTSQNYKRLVIVDPQFKSRKGHNYRYARGIADELGLETVVLAHVSFEPEATDSLQIRPILTFDQYNNTAFKDGYRPGLFERIGRYKDRVIQRLTASNGLWDPQSPVGLIVTLLAKVLSVILFIPALLHQLYVLTVGRGSSAHKDTTALELTNAFDAIALGAGDLVVFQTMMWPTFESLLEINIQRAKNFGCDALFIVHEDWLIYNTAFIRFVPAKLQRRVLESLPFKRSKIVATNQALSDYCAEWCGYRPAIVKEIEFPLADLPARKESASKNVNILIPGIYRGDKNFESIGHLVADINLQVENVVYTLHESVMARVAIPPQFADRMHVYADIEGAQAWLDFLAGFDVVLLPYDHVYQHRISGIIHEAKLLSIPVVCSKDIADANLLSFQSCLYSADGEGVGNAVRTALASDIHQYYKAFSPEPVKFHVAHEQGWVQHQTKPVAVQVKPAWTRCGTSVVLDQQMELLVDKGYFVVEIYLKTEAWVQTREQVEFLWQVMRGGREYCGGMAVRILLKDVTFFPLAGYVLKLVRKKIPAFFKRENIHATWCTPDKALQRFFERNNPEIALVNHIFNNDFARKYIPAKHFICETHDLQINQLLMRRPELLANYENELNYELNTLKEYDAVVNLNVKEHKIIENAVGDKAHYIRPAIVKRHQAKRYQSLRMLIAEQSHYLSVEKLPEKFDLLIVGDGHPANIESVSAFIKNVYWNLPEGTSLGIVGKVADRIAIDWHNEANRHLYCIGFMERLCNLYDFTELLVLADVVGEGIPIKTDEAVAECIPFVASNHAMRGFSTEELSLAGLQPAPDNTAMKESIEKLLADPVQRAALQKKLMALQQAINQSTYYDNWDTVIQSAS